MRNAILLLLVVLLCASSFASGHEVTVPVLGPSPLAAAYPSVATNGETFAAVWYNGGEVYGTIADASGSRITAADVPVMPISLSLGSVVNALTAVGRDYVLFWSDSSASYLTDLGPDLKAMQTIRLKDVPSLTNVSVASNASQIVVVGYTGNIFPPAQTVAYLLNRNGSLARSRFDLGGVGRVHASWSGKDFLIVNATPTGVVLERFATESEARLQISSASGRFSDPMPATAAAAASAHETLIVWSESADSVPQIETFWSAVATDDGHVATQQIYSQSPPTGGQANIIWNGEAYIATFGRLVFRLDRSGTSLGPPTDAGHSIGQIASIGEVVYGAGVEPFVSNAMVTVLRTASGIHDARSESLSITPAAQRDPAVASDGIDFMTVFREETGTTKSMKAAPIRRSPMAPVDQPLSLADTIGSTEAAIAHGNSVYMATWADANGVFFRRLSNQGVAIDAQPIKLSADRYSPRPDIVWNGRSFLVTWINTGGIVAAMVGEDAAISSTHVIAPNGSMEPRLSWNEKVFLLVYGVPQGCFFECVPQRAATYAVRIAADGTPLDTNPATIDREQLSAYSLAASRATVASNGSDFLVALDKSTEAMVVNVNTNGASITVGQPKSVFGWFTFVTSDIRWNGQEYVLASRYSSGTKQWLALTHLTSHGDPLSRFVTEINSRPASAPAVASNSLSEDAVVVAESVGDPAVPRAHVFFDSDFSLSPPPPAAPTNVTATGTSSSFTMRWDVGSDAEGVVIETKFGGYSFFTVVPVSDHSHTFNTPGITSVTLRALNAGGLSEAIGALLQTPPRRRATH